MGYLRWVGPHRPGCRSHPRGRISAADWNSTFYSGPFVSRQMERRESLVRLGLLKSYFFSCLDGRTESCGAFRSNPGHGFSPRGGGGSMPSAARSQPATFCQPSHHLPYINNALIERWGRKGGDTLIPPLSLPSQFFMPAGTVPFLIKGSDFALCRRGRKPGPCVGRVGGLPYDAGGGGRRRDVPRLPPRRHICRRAQDPSPKACTPHPLGNSLIKRTSWRSRKDESSTSPLILSGIQFFSWGLSILFCSYFCLIFKHFSSSVAWAHFLHFSRLSKHRGGV